MIELKEQKVQTEQRKYHYIYKITRNDGSGKYYIGLHSTNNLEDGYFGSGQVLWKSIKKYGKQMHTMEILEFLPDRKTLKDREREIVNEDLLKDPLCMNICLGGQCRNNLSDKQRKFISKKLQGRTLSEEHKAKLSEIAKAMTDEVKQKISAGGKKRFTSVENRKEHGEKIKQGLTESSREKMSASAKKINTPEYRQYKSEKLKQFNALLSEDERKLKAKHLTDKFAPGSDAAKMRARKIQESIKRNKEMRRENHT